MKTKNTLLWALICIIIVNGIFLASAVNILVQNYSFSAGRFSFQYDDTKLVVDRIGDFSYDSSGNLQAMSVYIKNKNATSSYSGYFELILDTQKYKVDVSLNGGETKGYTINLDPHVTMSGPLILDVNVFIAGAGGADLLAQRATAIADSAINGTLGTEWNDAKTYTGIPITPSGTANIWVKNDGTYLYIALQFTADSNDPWVAIQLGTSGCMDAGSDGALFGDNSYQANGYVDVEFTSGTNVQQDTTQNGKGAISIGVGNVVTIELKKPLNSGDSAGSDIAWTVGNTYNLVIAWDSNGGGSSGGTTNHRSTTPTARTILISA